MHLLNYRDLTKRQFSRSLRNLVISFTSEHRLPYNAGNAVLATNENVVSPSPLKRAGNKMRGNFVPHKETEKCFTYRIRKYARELSPLNRRELENKGSTNILADTSLGSRSEFFQANMRTLESS